MQVRDTHSVTLRPNLSSLARRTDAPLVICAVVVEPHDEPEDEDDDADVEMHEYARVKRACEKGVKEA